MVKHVVAEANEYLVITGTNVSDIRVEKKALIYPGQAYSTLKVSPETYSLKLEAVSSEKILFELPVLFVIGPRADDNESLVKYVRLLSSHAGDSEAVFDLIYEMIKGEAKGVVASMTVDQITGGNDEFQRIVYNRVQLVLNPFGLYIYNASIEEVKDIPGITTPREILQLQKEAERKKEELMQDANLQIFQKEKKIDVAATTIKEIDCEREVETKMCLLHIEKLRRDFLSKAKVVAEVKEQESNSELYRQQKLAEGHLFGKKREAEGILEIARAQGASMTENAQAQGFYVKTLLDAFKGNYLAMRDYLMITNGVYQEMAKINAGAVAGLKPNISVWTNGGQALEGSGEGSSSRDERDSWCVSNVASIIADCARTDRNESTVLAWYSCKHKVS